MYNWNWFKAKIHDRCLEWVFFLNRPSGGKCGWLFWQPCGPKLRFCCFVSSHGCLVAFRWTQPPPLRIRPFIFRSGLPRPLWQRQRRSQECSLNRNLYEDHWILLLLGSQGWKGFPCGLYWEHHRQLFAAKLPPLRSRSGNSNSHRSKSQFCRIFSDVLSRWCRLSFHAKLNP